MTSATKSGSPSSAVPFDHDVYVIAPDASRYDLANRLSARLAQLDSMLLLTYGEGLDCNDEIKGNYMWVCSDIATECRKLFEQLESWKTSDTISAKENAFLDGRDCALEWMERNAEKRDCEPMQEWRKRCLKNCFNKFQGDANLLGEWERGFDSAIGKKVRQS